jgi:hypothetical protein
MVQGMHGLQTCIFLSKCMKEVGKTLVAPVLQCSVLSGVTSKKNVVQVESGTKFDEGRSIVSSCKRISTLRRTDAQMSYNDAVSCDQVPNVRIR